MALPSLFTTSAAARVQDSAAALPHAPFAGVDSVVVESPLPGGTAAIFRFFFNFPQWFQIAGAIIGALLAVFVLAWLWRRRQGIRQWLVTRERRVQWALAAALFVVVAGAAGGGAASWNYMQHDNGFCTGCHIMKPAFQEFVAFEDKHDTLECHDCHQQPILVSMKQLYLWVAERPTEIGMHARVANAVCERCHVTGEAETWQRIASTAGHRVHLESDSASMQNLQCVTCHGEEVHRFVPANRTCGQSDCHDTRDTEIVLGKMADQTAIHCNACHRFTAEVPALAPTDSARGTLVPAEPQCLGCHEMRRVLADFDAARDPHGGTCGTCHNPHEQKAPAEAVTSCASASCHVDWRQEPFHLGAAHRRSGEQCLTCHEPHKAQVDASDCEGCHRSVRERTRLRPPLPFDTARALRRITLRHGPSEEEGLHPKGGNEWGWEEHAWRVGSPDGEARHGFPAGTRQAADVRAGDPNLEPRTLNLEPYTQNRTLPDSFPHIPHRGFACIECHTSRSGHGRLTFEIPRGCDICHHQARVVSRCGTCHQPNEIASVQQVMVQVEVPQKPARAREVPFSHPTHAAFRCVECHTTPVTLAAPPAIVQCRTCHAQHHEAARNCAACHRESTLQTEHEDLEAAHQRCDACHTPATVQVLTPTRTFCVTCHPTQSDHYLRQECTVCHFLAEPKVYQQRLLTRPGA